MNFKFFFSKINISCLKLRFLVNKIRKFSILNILIYLSFLNKKSSFILKKLLISCIFSLKDKVLNFYNLRILKISSEKGKYLKRLTYKSRGRFSVLFKNYSNVIIIFSNL